MLGFVVAMNSEAEVLLGYFEHELLHSLPYTTYTLNIGGQEAILVCSGVGKVHSAGATQYLIDRFSPSIIFNYGIAGGVCGETELGEVYIVDKCVQYDFDVSEVDDVSVGVIGDFDTPYFYCDTDYYKQHGVTLGVRSLATGDRFTACTNTAHFIKQNFDCPLRDMEGGAIAQVCTVNQVKLVMLKGISDYVGEHSVHMFKVYATQALAKLRIALSALLGDTKEH